MLAAMTLSMGDFGALISVMMVPIGIVVLYMQKISRDNETFKAGIETEIGKQQQTIDAHAMQLGELRERKIGKVDYLRSDLATRKAIERMSHEITVLATKLDVATGTTTQLARLADAMVEYTQQEKAPA